MPKRTVFNGRATHAYYNQVFPKIITSAFPRAELLRESLPARGANDPEWKIFMINPHGVSLNYRHVTAYEGHERGFNDYVNVSNTIVVN